MFIDISNMKQVLLYKPNQFFFHLPHRLQYFLQFTEAQEENPLQTSCPYLSQFDSWLTQGGGVAGVLPFYSEELIYIYYSSTTDQAYFPPKC